MFIPRLLAPQVLQTSPKPTTLQDLHIIHHPLATLWLPQHLSLFWGGGSFGEVQVLEALMGFTNCIHFITTPTIRDSLSAHVKPSDPSISLNPPILPCPPQSPHFYLQF